VSATLTVAVAQPPLVAHDVSANAAAHAAAVRAAGARVVVFPELSLTGYELGAALLDPGDPRLAPLVTACADTGSVALAGAPVEGPCIAVLAVDGERAWVAYRKVWLGDEEARRFVPGPAPAVLSVDGWRLGLAICKDTGVARHAADTAALGMDAYVAGTVKGAHEAALQADRARRVAVDHGVWVAVASFAGDTGHGFAPAAGRSGVWSPEGTPVATAGSAPGELVAATLSRAGSLTGRAATRG
jgi:predicted amidohydrolase